MKKFISLTAALAMSVLLLTGCDMSGKPAEDTPSAEPATSSVATIDKSEYPNYVQLPDYKSGTMKATAEKVIYDESQLDNQIAQYLNANPRTAVVDRPAQEGDYVDFDFEGYMDGEKFDGGTGSTALVIGSHSFIDEFEAGLVGLEAGKDYELNIHFPENYYEDLAGKPVLFKVKIHSVSEVLSPELTDEYVAEHFAPYTDVESFKNDMILAYKQMAETETLTNGQDAAFQVIREAATISMIPEDLITKHTGEVVQEFENNLTSFGLDLATYLQSSGMTEEDFLNEARSSAIVEAGTEMVVWAIAAQEGITVSEDEINECVETFKNYYEMTLDTRDIMNAYGRETFEYSVLFNKVMTAVADYVEITYVDPE